MDVGQALDNLNTALLEALEQAKREGAQAFEAGEFETAQQAADKGKAIEKVLEGAKQLSQQWATFKSPAMDTHIPKATGWKSDSPDEEFIFPILQVLEDLGGKGKVEEILDRVELMHKEKLGPALVEQMEEGQSHQWRETARASQKLMITKGLIYPNSPKGIWQITPQGRLSLFEHQR